LGEVTDLVNESSEDAEPRPVKVTAGPLRSKKFPTLELAQKKQSAEALEILPGASSAFGKCAKTVTYSFLSGLICVNSFARVGPQSADR
jgi:hypothetical protein